ncbi:MULTISPECIES: trans-sulfuration enzyme family protein [Shouchella]|uniref:PLP-dependent aspartate aminotransferase family protein n=2 Tax=Shouchella TaxID=2893057 RepID=A0ABY7W914_9BACI|nr:MULTISPECIES: PLP-dependent aspartate aminotransferase family protein [Shouchella]MED4128979.1 PLP-dependent aspartate aminotransferase family protein [Shouchella miscanthi]WDF04561.1 PLP-dependent aspartate aminotransferase family protein [Shouchella hunanensis]GAF22398.1 O-acetylhomoserine sulfhydrylase [Bacillus sp. JCM 19047]
MERKERYFNTQSVHFTKKDTTKNKSKARPIYQTSAFVFENLDDMESYFTGEKDYLYSRYGNPNTEDLGKGVALLEEMEDGIATSSGMSAILCAVLSVCQAGDHLLAALDVYGGTYTLFEQELKTFGIDVSFVQSHEDWKKEMRANTKAFFCESVTNPHVRIEDLETIVTFSAEHQLRVIVDNTFATPFLVKPVHKGVDLVIHSATKYLGGHSDVTAGVVVGSQALMERVKQLVITMGATLSPFEAWLACRGLKTLGLRMERQCANAEKLAAFLKKQPQVDQVYYPEGLSGNGNGAIVTMRLKPDVDVHTFFSSFSFVKIAPTLAGVETSISYPVGTSHRSVPEEKREALGISPQDVRISVGIEDSRDIQTDFLQALNQA